MWPTRSTNGSSHFSEDAATVLKFHGTYQQDDRDVRKQLKKEGKEAAHQFMVRVRMRRRQSERGPVSRLRPSGPDLGNGTLRITTRQEFQLHGVLKTDLATHDPPDQRGADVDAGGLWRRRTQRALLPGPAPRSGSRRPAMPTPCAGRRTALRGRRSYWEIWLDGEKIETLPPAGAALVPTPGDDAVEPIYGKTYLPRKFKTAFALPEDNCTDIHANDLGFLGVVEAGRLVGYNVLAGGGPGHDPKCPKDVSVPGASRSATSIAADVLKIGEAVLKVFRDFGNRSDRKRARLKYIIHDWGMPAFRAKVEEYLGHPLADPKPIEVSGVDDHLGWHSQGDGKLFLGIPVENGRIKDDGDLRLASGLRAFFQKYKTPARLTCQQKILLADLDPAWRGEIEQWLAEYGIATVEQVSTVRRWSMACPALPTCGLAVTEAERPCPTILDQLEVALASLGLARRTVHRADDRLPQRLRPSL